MDRRRFLGGILGAAVMTAAGTPAAGASGPRRPAHPLPRTSRRGPDDLPETWGVQLYTLRSLMQEDVEGTLRTVAELGYGEVEFAGIFGRDPEALRRTLDDLGLVAPSTHVSLSAVESDLTARLEEAVALGHSMLIVPSLPRSVSTADDFRAVGDALNRAGEAAAERGLVVGFHNHARELQPIDGDGAPLPLEIMLDRTDPALVTFQLDLFWAVHAGVDPVTLFERHQGRFSSVHAKDRATDGTMVSVGDGAMDFARLLAAGEAAGVEHVFVEHDNPDDAVRSVRRSIAHLESLR